MEGDKTRKCPQCSTLIVHADKYKARYFEKKGALCKACGYLSNRRTKLPAVGTKFGSWTVIDNRLIKSGDGKPSKIKVECSCGVVEQIVPLYLLDGRSKQCNNCKFDKMSALAFTGYMELSGTYYNILQNNAKQRNLIFDVSIEYLYDLFIAQDRKCALTDQVLSLNPYYIREQRYTGVSQTASVDRIDSNKGYIEGNVQWVHRDINFMKRSLSQKEFISLCELVVKKYNNV